MENVESSVWLWQAKKAADLERKKDRKASRKGQAAADTPSEPLDELTADSEPAGKNGAQEEDTAKDQSVSSQREDISGASGTEGGRQEHEESRERQEDEQQNSEQQLHEASEQASNQEHDEQGKDGAHEFIADSSEQQQPLPPIKPVLEVRDSDTLRESGTCLLPGIFDVGKVCSSACMFSSNI